MVKINFIENSKEYPANDIGISKLFMDCFKDELLFCNDGAVWYVWNKKYWQKDTRDGGLRNEKLKQFAKFCNYSIVTNKTIDDTTKTALLKEFSKLFKKGYRDTILRDAESICPVQSSIFDKDNNLFNCQNGTYDFAKNTFKEFDKNDYITNISNITFDKDADCPRFKNYLNEVMENDTQKIDYLLKMASYGFTGNVHHDAFFVFYGAKTRNGKSTFVNQVFYMLGTYAGSLKPASITRKQLNSGGNLASPDLADVKDKRFVTVSEIESGMMLDIALIKSLTGKNPVKARFLYENDILFYPKFKIFFDTNFLPKMTDDTIFQSDRLHLIEFTRHFEKSERDLQLADKLKEETSGVFNLIIEYYNKLKKEGFIIPKSSTETITRYQLNSNNILAYKTARLVNSPNSYLKTSELYEDYKAWCEEEELKNLSRKNFKEEMLKHGAYYTGKERRQNSITYWVKGFNFLADAENGEQACLIPIEDNEILLF